MTRIVAFTAAALAAAACASNEPEAPPASASAARAAPAAQTAAEERDCFNVRSVSGFSTVDEDTVRVDVGPSRSYELDARGATCVNLRWANQIALESDPASSFLCVGDRLSTAKIHTDQGDECLIEDIRRAAEEPAPLLDGEETAAELSPPWRPGRPG